MENKELGQTRGLHVRKAEYLTGDKGKSASQRFPNGLAARRGERDRG